jgi:hypothetical protein
MMTRVPESAVRKQHGQVDKAQRELEKVVRRAIAKRTQRGAALDAELIADEAIVLADRGASYAQFMKRSDPKGWPNVRRPFVEEVQRQLGENARPPVEPDRAIGTEQDDRSDGRK